VPLQRPQIADRIEREQLIAAADQPSPTGRSATFCRSRCRGDQDVMIDHVVRVQRNVFDRAQLEGVRAAHWKVERFAVEQVMLDEVRHPAGPASI